MKTVLKSVSDEASVFDSINLPDLHFPERGWAELGCWREKKRREKKRILDLPSRTFKSFFLLSLKEKNKASQ